MAYEKQTWNCGDEITADKLNHMEKGIADAGGSDSGENVLTFAYDDDAGSWYMVQNTEKLASFYEDYRQRDKQLVLFVETSTPLCMYFTFNGIEIYTITYCDIHAIEDGDISIGIYEFVVNATTGDVTHNKLASKVIGTGTQPLEVIVTQTDSGYTANVDYETIKSAVDSGRIVFASFTITMRNSKILMPLTIDSRDTEGNNVFFEFITMLPYTSGILDQAVAKIYNNNSVEFTLGS